MNLPQSPTASSPSEPGSPVPPNRPTVSPQPQTQNQASPARQEGSSTNSQAYRYRSLGGAERHGISCRARAGRDISANPVPRIVTPVARFEGLRLESELSVQTGPTAANEGGQARIGESNLQPIQYHPGLALAEVQTVRLGPRTSYEPTHIKSEASARPNVIGPSDGLLLDSRPDPQILLRQNDPSPSQAPTGFGEDASDLRIGTLSTGFQLTPTQNGVTPTQAPRCGLINSTLGNSSQLMPTPNGVAPTEASDDAGHVTNDHPVNGNRQALGVQWGNIPLTNRLVRARSPVNVAATDDDSAMHPVTPERNVPPVHRLGSVGADYDDYMDQPAPPSSDSTPENMTPSPSSVRIPARYTSAVVAPRSRPRDQPIGALSFMGVSQGGMLLWHSQEEDDEPIAQLPSTVAEQLIVYEHLWYPALETARTASDRHIWLGVLQGLEAAVRSIEGRYDESEIIRINGYRGIPYL